MFSKKFATKRLDVDTRCCHTTISRISASLATRKVYSKLGNTNKPSATYGTNNEGKRTSRPVLYS